MREHKYRILSDQYFPKAVRVSQSQLQSAPQNRGEQTLLETEEQGYRKGEKNIKMLTSSFKKKKIKIKRRTTHTLPKPDILTTRLLHGLHYVSVNYCLHKQKVSDQPLQF